MIKLLFKMTC